MGKIKGFLFAVRHREILMTNLGLLAKPFTPLHRSTFGRLPEQEGEGKAARAARGWGFSFGEGLDFIYSSSSLAAGNFMIAKPLSVRPTYSHSTLSLPSASFSTK